MTTEALKQMTFDPNAEGPLKGVRVLDFSRLVAGNMLTLQLADFGAEVVKVEAPGTGDTLRHWKNDGIPLHWKVYGRNKKSITLNLKAEGAREIVLELVRNFDVMVESFRHRYLEDLGLDPATLMAANPKLILVRLSGFGQTGPYSKRPGFGTLVEAMSGFAATNGFEDREPVLPPLALADMIAGLYGAMATVIAVRNVETNDGRGQIVDLSLLESIFSILGPEAALYQVTGEVRQRVGSGSVLSSPRNVYKTADGNYVAISGSTEAMARRLFKVIGRADLIDDPRFNSNAERIRHRHEVDAIIGSWMEERNLNDAISFFEDVGVTAGPVYSIREFLDDPHVRDRGIVVELPDPDLGQVRMHAITPRLTETPGQYRMPAPDVGQHNHEIYGRLGYAEEKIHALLEEGVI